MTKCWQIVEFRVGSRNLPVGSSRAKRRMALQFFAWLGSLLPKKRKEKMTRDLKGSLSRILFK